LYLSLAAAVMALGLAGWAWLVMSRIEDDLREFAGFEGLHFDI
jgi:hypothetical protein